MPAPPVVFPHVNNTWLPGEVSQNTVFIFVHGVLSDSEGCWRNKTTGAFWPEMVQQDILGAGVFLGGYHTNLSAGAYGIRDCAQELFTYLSQPLAGRPAVLRYERLIFVCHSLGGIVVRYLLEAWRQAFIQQAVDLILVASPSLGSRYAVWLESVSELLKQETGKQLTWRAPLIEDLDGRFKDLKEHKWIPRLTGQEFVEDKFPYVGLLQPIVTEASAARYFGSPITIPGTDHMSIVKPPDRSARMHVELLKQYAEFDAAYPVTMKLPQAPQAAAQGPPPAVLECSHLTWSLRINANGDGYNELTFEGISAARTSEGAVYDLPPASVDRGSLSGYLLDRSRTSPHIRLEQQPPKDRSVEAAIHFDRAPSLEIPQTFRLQMLDFDAYALDREELSGGEDLDYAEKTIRWEQIGDFIVEVSFPDSMSLSAENPPFVEAYQNFPSEGGERAVFDAALTRQAAAGFHFSPLARTAYLRIAKPPQNSAYRVCWRLGDPLIGGTRNAQLGRLEVRRQVFLSIRDLFGSKGGEKQESRKAELLKPLAGFGEFAAQLLRQALNAPECSAVVTALERELEIVLMAWDSSSDVLRFVAGTNIESVWNEQLKVGSGIAGQSAQWLRARYYDDERARNTPVADEYVVLAPGKRHAWLLAMPLWMEDSGGRTIGVLNVGTFDASFGRILRVLQKAEIMNALQLKANTDLLPSILKIMIS